MKGKLNPEKVAAILRDVATPCSGCGRPVPLRLIAAHYGVSRAMISHIANGSRWPDVPFHPEAANDAAE